MLIDYFPHLSSVFKHFVFYVILVDAAAVDNNQRISPENNLDFYGYSQATPYSVKNRTVVVFFLFISGYSFE